MRVDLSRPIKIEELASVFHTAKINDKDVVITSVVTNSKLVTAGTLFIALTGKSFDGHDYIEEAIRNGAVAIFSQKNIKDFSKSITFFLVEDTVKALGELAVLYKSFFSVKTVAVTGSVGKTSTCHFISTLLGNRYKVHSTKENYNNHIGVPLTMLGMPKDTEILVLEFGMNHTKEIAYLSHMASPDIAIITNVGHAHIGELGSIDAIYRAKLEIVEGVKSGVLLLPDNMSYYPSVYGIKTVLCGETKDAAYRLARERSGVVLPNEEAVNLKEQNCSLPYLSASLFAVAVCHLLGFQAKEMEALLQFCTLPKCRLEEITVREITIINDAYNASPEAMREALVYAAGLNAGRKIALLGDMLELGEITQAAHFDIGKQLAALGFHKIFLAGDYVQWIKEGALHYGLDASCIEEGTVNDCTKALIKYLKSGDTLLIKGSHQTELWKVADQLKRELQ